MAFNFMECEHTCNYQMIRSLTQTRLQIPGLVSMGDVNGGMEGGGRRGCDAFQFDSSESSPCRSIQVASSNLLDVGVIARRFDSMFDSIQFNSIQLKPT